MKVFCVLIVLLSLALHAGAIYAASSTVRRLLLAPLRFSSSSSSRSPPSCKSLRTSSPLGSVCRLQ
jgi:hypothetical protein